MLILPSETKSFRSKLSIVLFNVHLNWTLGGSESTSHVILTVSCLATPKTIPGGLLHIGATERIREKCYFTNDCYISVWKY